MLGWKLMFTGIVEAVGTLAEVTGTGGGYRVSIHTPLATQLKLGDSLAVNGVCLTVILIDGEHVFADVGPETSRVTTLGVLQRGQSVNLERPLRFDGRVDGHFVQGHVDGVGTVEDVRSEGRRTGSRSLFQRHWRPALFARVRSPWTVSVSRSLASASASLIFRSCPTPGPLRR